MLELSAFETIEKIRSRELTAKEVLEAHLAQIKKVDGVPGKLDFGELSETESTKVHAFITLTEDLAYQQAEEVDRQLDNGIDPGILAGVPITVKDIFCVNFRFYSVFDGNCFNWCSIIISP